MSKRNLLPLAQFLGGSFTGLICSYNMSQVYYFTIRENITKPLEKAKQEESNYDFSRQKEIILSGIKQSIKDLY